MKTVCMSEETHKELMGLKLDYNTRSAEEIIKDLIIEHKKRRFMAAGKVLREAMIKKNVTPEDLKKIVERE